MKAMVLCSGGVDSTTCLGIAVDKYGAEMLWHCQYIMDKGTQRKLSQLIR